MENLILVEAVSELLAGMPFVQFMLDLLLKSSLLIGATFLVAAVFRRRISNSGAHLLWINSMLCIALLPLAVVTLAWLPAAILSGGPVSVIAIDSSAVISSESATPQIGQLLIAAIYFVIAATLLCKLLFSALALRRIENDAFCCEDESILMQVERLRGELQISRAVSMKLSDDVASPMSYGLFNPVVVLPTAAEKWSQTTREDVLVHELSHIRRLDWLTMLFCHVLTSVLWFNPLVWFAKNRVNEAAEQACDTAVLRCGSDGVNYAEDLLRLARESLGNKQTPVLAQLMFDESSLSLRIKNILDGGFV